MLAPPTALWAQPGAKPTGNAARVAVDPARVIEAMDVCRQAPPGHAEAFRYAREQGFIDLPPEVRANMPVETLVRGEVRLRVESSLFADGPGSCTVYATISDGHGYDEIVATLAARLGQAGDQRDGQRMSWRIDGRPITASLMGNSLDIWVGFPELTPEQAAAARAAAQARQAEAAAQLAAATQVSPAEDIAAAATICVAALGGNGLDRGELERAGWAAESERGLLAHAGSNVRIFITGRGGGQCIVDAYGEGMGAFDAIREAIRAQLTARFGREVRLVSSSGSESSFSQGQGFAIGGRIGILSSERRPNGLSIRFTVMALR